MPNPFASKFAKFGDTLKDAAETVIDKIDDKIDLDLRIGESLSACLCDRQDWRIG